MKIPASDIISAARECLGTPFRHQGRLCGRSLDCAGVAVYVAKKLGLEVRDQRAYGRHPNNGILEDMLDKQICLESLPIDKIEPGCLLLMRFGEEPQHLAILTDNNTIIHGYYNASKVAEHRLSSVWRARIVKAYRFIR